MDRGIAPSQACVFNVDRMGRKGYETGSAGHGPPALLIELACPVVLTQCPQPRLLDTSESQLVESKVVERTADALVPRVRRHVEGSQVAVAH